MEGKPENKLNEDTKAEQEKTYSDNVHEEQGKIGKLSLEKIPTKDIVNSDNPRENRDRHTDIMKRISKLNDLINCK